MLRPDLAPQLAGLPAKPGVYQYFGAEGEVIYVGKAVNLRNRVRSYFHKAAVHDPKTHRLVTQIASVEWIVTGSELEALLLEMNLIKQHRPRYNVVLKDDKRYPYIKVTWADAFPTVYATRRVVQDGARYFGPYTSAGAMHETLEALRKVFPYLDCNRTITGQDPRACLYHDIGLCLGPCIGAVDRAGYRAMIAGLCRFLEGETEPVLDKLRTEMQAHAERLEFEQAARLRDRIAAIEQVAERQRIIAPTLADQDVIALAREDGSAVAQVFFVRDGKLIGRETFQLAGTDEEAEGAVLAEFIKQLYDETALVPGEIVVPEQIVESEIIERWLSGKRGTKVRITVPQRGRKRELVDVAIDNAAETLRALAAAHAAETRPDTAAEALGELQAALGLPRPPRRIECYDISHLQGTQTVGSMVVFEEAAPLRADYRHFRVQSATGGDDYAAMTEVLTRRFQRLARYRAEGLAETGVAATSAEGDANPGAAGPVAGSDANTGTAGPVAGTVASPTGDGGGAQTSFEKTPDLVLIDGGKGQLRAAAAVLASLGLDDLPLASLAKRLEELYRPGQRDPVMLPRDSQALYLVQRARDEAHRFAVTYNRKLRHTAGLRSSLDEVPGIGPKRRRMLLVHFGSLARVRAASVDEIAAVPGMTRRAAEQVKAYL